MLLLLLWCLLLLRLRERQLRLLRGLLLHLLLLLRLLLLRRYLLLVVQVTHGWRGLLLAHLLRFRRRICLQVVECRSLAIHAASWRELLAVGLRWCSSTPCTKGGPILV